MKLQFSVTYDVDNRMLQDIRTWAWLNKVSFEKAALELYDVGEIDERYSDERTVKISPIDDGGFYNDHLCVIASILSTDKCHDCTLTACPHSGHSDKEYFEGVAKYKKCGDTMLKVVLALCSDNSVHHKTDNDDYQYAIQQQSQYQQEKFQQEQLQLQRQQIEAQKEMSRNAIRAQIAALEGQLNATVGPLFGIGETNAERQARERQRIALQSQISSLKKQLDKIK